MFVRALLGLSAVVFAMGCAARAADSDDPVSSESSIESAFAPPVLPHAGGTGDLSPWGGVDDSRWRPEATLANAASAALNDAWAAADVRDVAVAVPLRMWNSDLYPYGDGQSNAVPSFEGFPGKGRAPVVAALVHRSDGTRRVTLRFDRAIGTSLAIEILYFANGRANKIDLAARSTANGEVVVEWAWPSTLAPDASIAVHPKGWQDWFPLFFEQRIAPARSLDADGRLLDRERIASETTTSTPFERLTSHVFEKSYNGAGPGARPTPYTPSDVHGRFPYFNRPIVTAVGSGFMWVADERPAGFKSLYACFTGRRAQEEAAAPDGGVTSGAGWHRIGDPAETIVNDLEKDPILVAYAKHHPFATSSLPHGGFAWGLSDVATFRWLRPGEAFTAPRGTYHWFLFAQKRNVCTELLTHPE